MWTDGAPVARGGWGGRIGRGMQMLGGVWQGEGSAGSAEMLMIMNGD